MKRALFLLALLGSACAGPGKPSLELALDQDFPDPTVLRASDGAYYAYATESEVDGRGVRVQVARSTDLARWEWLGDALAQPAWADRFYWAPHVAEHDGLFYLYYSGDPPARKGLCLGVATSTSPAGPFQDVGKPLLCGETFVNIDPMSFDDPATGKRLLYWGSGFKPIKVQELAEDRVSFAPGSAPVEVLAPDPARAYEKLVEGAWVLREGGYYYLFYSGDDCCHGTPPNYAVMVARSTSAVGPFEKKDRPILVGSGRWGGPGHNSVVRDAAGAYWLFYHAIDARNPKLQRKLDRIVRRPMLRSRLVFKDGWPAVE